MFVCFCKKNYALPLTTHQDHFFKSDNAVMPGDRARAFL